jgi:hypothetical protein
VIFAGHLLLILLVAVSPVVAVMIFYWTIRFAVRHGIEDAWRRRNQPPPVSGYWDPARFEAHLQGPTSE